MKLRSLLLFLFLALPIFPALAATVPTTEMYTETNTIEKATLSIPLSIRLVQGPGIGQHSVALLWNETTQSVLFKVYRGTTPGGEGSTPYATGLTTTNYTDTVVVAGTTYYYLATAYTTANDESSPSNEASAKIPTPPAPPTGLTAAPQ